MASPETDSDIEFSEPSTPDLRAVDKLTARPTRKTITNPPRTAEYRDRGKDQEHVVVGLERRWRAIEYFMGRLGGQQPNEHQTRWQDVDEQFRRRLSAILVNKKLYPDADTAWKRFEYWKGRVSTTQQREAMSMTKDEFVPLFEQTRQFLDASEDEIMLEAKRRLERHETAESRYGEQTSRNYERLKQEGIEIAIDPVALEELRRRTRPDYQGDDRIELDSQRPILEQIKTERLLQIEGLADSKISLAIHDTFDHLWLMSLLERTGTLERYKGFLTKIGNPYWRDVFGREGEVVASISYSYRYFNAVERGIQPYFSLEQMEQMLVKGIDRSLDPKWGEVDPQRTANIHHALQKLRSGNPLERQSLAYGFSNYAVEYMEQIRKHGNVKIQDEQGVFVDKLSMVDPEMLALFIEGHTLLSDPANKSEKTLVKLEVLLEAQFEAALRGNGPAVFNITLEQLNDPSEIPELPNGKSKWFGRNYGFAATRNKII